MGLTYKGILKNNHIDWKDEVPPQNEPLDVQVTILNKSKKNNKQGAKMAEALNKIAESGGFNKIDNPSEWQRKIRKDRKLPR